MSWYLDKKFGFLRFNFYLANASSDWSVGDLFSYQRQL